MKASEAKTLTEAAFQRDYDRNKELYNSDEFYEFITARIESAARLKEYSAKIDFDQVQPHGLAVDTGLLTQALNEKFEGFHVSIYAKGFALQWS